MIDAEKLKRAIGDCKEICRYSVLSDSIHVHYIDSNGRDQLVYFKGSGWKWFFRKGGGNAADRN